MKRSAGAVLVLVLVACSTAPEPSPPTQPTGPTRFERGVVAALAADDLEVQLQALGMLQNYPDPAHAAAIAPLCASEVAELRSAARCALGAIGSASAAAASIVLPYLHAGLHDGVRQCQESAIHSCVGVAATDWSELEGLLGDPAPSVRVMAALVLASHGVELAPRDVAGVLRDCAGTYLDRQLVSLFPLLREPSDGELLAPFLAHADGKIRFRAHETKARLEAIAAGEALDWQPPSQRLRATFQRENAAAEARLHAMPWEAVAREQVLQAVRGARLVTFGELHEEEGPLRDAQREVLRAMVAATPGHVVLGYEPSVRRVHQLLVDAAYALGVESVALEQNWAELQPADRHAERDDEAAATIHELLASDPERRLLVLRGEGHTLPGGYLDSRLAVPPVLILSSMRPPTFAELGDPPLLRGRTFRIGDSGRVFYWGYRDPLDGFDELAVWLAAH